MTFALLPVKDPAQAKQRLSTAFSAVQREQLARAMFQDVLAQVMLVRGLDRVVVVSSDAEVLRQAEAAGGTPLAEESQSGHSQSADEAAQRCMEWGATSLLLVPSDVPSVQAAEMERMLDAAALLPAPSLVIVPDTAGTGTNAMVRTPPNLIESRFGPGSFRAHVDQAEAKRARVVVGRPPGLVFDLDTPEDVRLLFERDPHGKITSLLRRQLA